MTLIIICIYLIIGLAFAEVLESNNFFSTSPAQKFEYYAVVFGYPIFIILMLVVAIKLIFTKQCK